MQHPCFQAAVFCSFHHFAMKHTGTRIVMHCQSQVLSFISGCSYYKIIYNKASCLFPGLLSPGHNSNSIIQAHLLPLVLPHPPSASDIHSGLLIVSEI